MDKVYKEFNLEIVKKKIIATFSTKEDFAELEDSNINSLRKKIDKYWIEKTANREVYIFCHASYYYEATITSYNPDTKVTLFIYKEDGNKGRLGEFDRELVLEKTKDNKDYLDNIILLARKRLDLDSEISEQE